MDKYVSALEQQKRNSDSLSMEVDIDAGLPRLKKQGKLHALRFISKIGKIRYLLQAFEGDNTVKKDVIGRYLQAETQATGEKSGPSIAITPENYKFKYKGIEEYANRSAHVFELTPKEKRVGLYSGELWVDTETFLPLREWGEFVRNPSVFLKNVYFVRDYWIYQGVSVPRRIISTVDTRLVGKAELTIWFDEFKFGEEGESAFTTAANTALARADAAY